MAPAKKRTDIYNLKALEEKLPVDMKNKSQKLNFLFKGVDMYATKEDIGEIIKVLNQQHKEKIAELKAMIK